MKLLIIFPTINISLTSDIVSCVSPFTKSPSHSVLKGILMAVQGAYATSVIQLKGIGSTWDFETVKVHILELEHCRTKISLEPKGLFLSTQLYTQANLPTQYWLPLQSLHANSRFLTFLYVYFPSQDSVSSFRVPADCSQIS